MGWDAGGVGMGWGVCGMMKELEEVLNVVVR